MSIVIFNRLTYLKFFHAMLTLTETADIASSINIIFIITPTSIFDANRLTWTVCRNQKHTTTLFPLESPQRVLKTPRVLFRHIRDKL